MRDIEGRVAGMYCIAWTLLLAAGYFGSQAVELGRVPRAVWQEVLPGLTALYAVLLALSVLWWMWLARRSP